MSPLPNTTQRVRHFPQTDRTKRTGGLKQHGQLTVTIGKATGEGTWVDVAVEVVRDVIAAGEGVCEEGGAVEVVIGIDVGGGGGSEGAVV